MFQSGGIVKVAVGCVPIPRLNLPQIARNEISISILTHSIFWLTDRTFNLLGVADSFSSARRDLHDFQGPISNQNSRVCQYVSKWEHSDVNGRQTGMDDRAIKTIARTKLRIYLGE
jgi:hypothetical protein